MTSLSKTPKSIQPLQRLMVDFLGSHPHHQRQESSLEFDDSFSDRNAVYWADDLAVPNPSAHVWRYQTALAVGATVVCSAGAIMQHTETGFWAPSDTPEPGAADIHGSQQKHTDTKVSTPPVVNSQVQPPVAFSSGHSPAGNEVCRDSTCKGIAFIEQRLPEIQGEIRGIRAEMAQFQAKHTAQNLQTHRSILTYRSSDVSRRQAELAVRSQQLDQEFSSLTMVLAIHPDKAAAIADLIQTDASYQQQLQLLKALQQDIATEYSHPNLNNARFNQLYTEYTQTADQLRQIAQSVIINYIAAVSLESPDPLWQENSYHGLLEELIDLAHLQQMVAVEETTLNQMDANLTERRTELASLLRQYAVMQRQLEGQNQVLQQYIARRQELKNELT